MAIRFVSLSPIEQEAYMQVSTIADAVDAVGNMIVDLHEKDATVDVVLALNDPDDTEQFTLAFSGCTLSLEFYPDRIEVVDFNDGDEQILETFSTSEANAATLWLINYLKE